MEFRSLLEAPKIDELECLIMWPAGTVGEAAERKLIQKLLDLMEVHGFGRVPQLCNQIEDIWRHPDTQEKYQEMKREYFALLAELATKLPKPTITTELPKRPPNRIIRGGKVYANMDSKLVEIEKPNRPPLKLINASKKERKKNEIHPFST